METVVIVIHLMVIVAMVAMVLLQRSEGGALGIGGGGFMTSRGQGNVLTRSTAILAAAFFATSILLTILARFNTPPSAILDTVPPPTAPAPTDTTTPGTGQGILDTLEGLSKPQTPPAPSTSDGTSIPTTPVVPPAPTEPQVPSSQ